MTMKMLKYLLICLEGKLTSDSPPATIPLATLVPVCPYHSDIVAKMQN